jgi:amino acid permease
MVHLIALALLGGAVLIVDLRLLGLILKGQSARLIGRDLSRILIGSLVVMILTGIALLSEEAGKCYFSPAFRWKMALLAVAVLFYFTMHRKALLRTDHGRPTPWARTTALISLTLWLGVGIAGRAIGLL